MQKTLLFALLFATTQLFSQSKMNFDLARKVKQEGFSSQSINVFVKGDIEFIKQLTLNANGTFRYSSGDIAVISLPISAIKGFASNKEVVRMEAYTPHIKPMNDTMEIQSNIVQVQAGNAPLTQAYDGTGVVVGIIDTGIDFTHPDFKDSLGNSRINYLWDQTQPTAANTPMPYNYGQEWTNTDIDGGLASAHNDLAYSGHGTHVAGVCVGNGLAINKYKGVAPKAHIILVALDFNSTSPTTIADATNYIYAKAAAMGMPCVINASVGDYYGSHDGKDLQAQLISNMIDAQAGQSFVAAAGNAGNFPYHLGYTVTSDTNFTMVAGTQPYIQIWADTANFKNVQFTVGADQMSPHSFRGNLPFTSILPHVGVFMEDTLYNAGNRIGIIDSYGDLIGGTYSMEYLITPDSAYNWRLMTTGTGKFDAWTFDFYNGALPTSATMPDSIYYKQTDTKETTVSGFVCLDNVIGVANYTNRKSYIDYNNNLFVNNALTPGQIVASSSHGPTRDNRIKPDIAAPGDMTMAAVVLSISTTLATVNPASMAFGGYHVRDGGTSHASPVVAGVAALYLQQNPTATAMDVKNAILGCPTRDTFTGMALPDNQWGAGKVNAFGALTMCGAVGINMYGENPLSMMIYPNPLANGSAFNVYFSNFDLKKKTELKIYNTLGELVKTVIVSNDNTTLQSDLSSGIYFCNLFQNGNKISSQKLVITK